MTKMNLMQKIGLGMASFGVFASLNLGQQLYKDNLHLMDVKKKYSSSVNMGGYSSLDPKELQDAFAEVVVSGYKYLCPVIATSEGLLVFIAYSSPRNRKKEED
jgi:hypothetical protein